MEPAIRLAAITRFNLATEEDLESLLPLLYDETKAVRFEVANRLSYLDTTLIPNNYREALKSAYVEQLEVLKYNADFPIGKFNLANYYYQHKDYKKSEQFYLKAIAQDEELFMAKMNLSYLYSTMGLPIKSEEILEEYVAESPDNADALYNYGLILSENKKYKKSLEYLIKASKIMPSNGRVDYNIAMLYEFFGDKIKAEEYLLIAVGKDQESFSNYSNLLNFYVQNKDEYKAQKLINEMKHKFPDR